MKFELKPTIVRAGVIGGVVAAVVSLVNLIPVLGCLLAPIALLVSFAIPIAVGAYAIILGRQAGSPMGNIGQDAVDGGLAGIVAGVIAGIASFVVGFARAAFQIGVDTSAAGNPTTGAAALGIGLIIGLCFGIVFVLIFGGVFGAVGGAGYSLLKQNQSGSAAGGPPMSPPPPPPTA